MNDDHEFLLSCPTDQLESGCLHAISECKENCGINDGINHFLLTVLNHQLFERLNSDINLAEDGLGDYPCLASRKVQAISCVVMPAEHAVTEELARLFAKELVAQLLAQDLVYQGHKVIDLQFSVEEWVNCGINGETLFTPRLIAIFRETPTGQRYSTRYGIVLPEESAMDDPLEEIEPQTFN